MLAFLAITQAQEIIWSKVDTAPPPPRVTVPIGAIPSIIHYSFKRAAEEIVRLLNPLFNPPPRTNPTRSTTHPIGAVLETRLPSVLPRGLFEDNTQDLPCAPQPRGAGYRPLPDTAENFLDQDEFSRAAEAAKVPAGYSMTFGDLKASCSSYGYLGFDTEGEYVWITLRTDPTTFPTLTRAPTQLHTAGMRRRVR